MICLIRFTKFGINICFNLGNITEDGRISRLIDDWSEDNEDQELGIINDNWAGSGLSTPEIDHLR